MTVAAVAVYLPLVLSFFTQKQFLGAKKTCHTQLFYRPDMAVAGVPSAVFSCDEPITAPLAGMFGQSRLLSIIHRLKFPRVGTCGIGRAHALRMRIDVQILYACVTFVLQKCSPSLPSFRQTRTKECSVTR